MDSPYCPDGARLIPLTRGLYAIVDEADHAELSQFKWYAKVTRNGRCYAARMVRRRDGSRTAAHMHRHIHPHGEVVDHINGNSLDNRRSNLRPATDHQNRMNRTGPQRNNRSGYLGVYWRPDKQRWAAKIKVAGRNIHLGYFPCPIEAAKVRDSAALVYHGEFASLNFRGVVES